MKRLLLATVVLGLIAVLCVLAERGATGRYYKGGRVTVSERAYKYAVSPQLASEYNSEFRDSGIERFTVSTDGITRIHDLINDPDRDCVWGVTRSDTAVNYVFRIDRDGTVAKTATGGAGVNRCMSLTWGGSHLWASVYSSPGQLLRINPHTSGLDFYELAAGADEATGIAYNDGYVFVAAYDNVGPDSKVYRFNVSTEAIDEYTVSDVYLLYWGLCDGTYFWFAGADPNDDSAKLLKMAADGTYSTYDLGASSSGSEITYDGTYIWHGNNDGSKILVRFDTRDNSITTVDLDISPRVVGFDGELLWLVNCSSNYTRASVLQDILTEGAATLTGCTYTHGLTFDGLNAWIGTWQDTCYVYRVPMFAFAPSVVIGTSSVAHPLQVYRDSTGWTAYIKNRNAGVGANSGLLIDVGQDVGDNILSLRSLAGTDCLRVTADGKTEITGRLDVDGKTVLTPSSDQTRADDSAIVVSDSIVRVAGDGGAALLDTAPAIEDGAADGQIVIIQGTHDVNTVTIADNCNCQLAGGVNAALGKGDTVCLLWDAGDSDWYEISRSGN